MSEEQTVQEETQGPDIKGLFDKFEGGPSSEQIESWKQEHGEIFCSAFSEEEFFVFRPLKRREFLDMQMQQQQEAPVDAEELIVKTCVLWASKKAKMALENKAGSMTTIQEQILQNSNFVAPQVAAALVVKL